jgi:hypothetical protein
MQAAARALHQERGLSKLAASHVQFRQKYASSKTSWDHECVLCWRCATDLILKYMYELPCCLECSRQGCLSTS